MSELNQPNEASKGQVILTLGDVSIHYYRPASHSKGILYTDGLRFGNQHDLARKTENIHPSIELYLLLPSHWDLEKKNQKWPIHVLKRMVDARHKKGAWYGPGDTLTAHPSMLIDDEVIDGDNDSEASMNPKTINGIFRQNHFFLTEPLEAGPLLKEVLSADISWLAIVPIFQKEFDYKTRRSALELMMNFEKNKITELVDEHRPMAVKKRLFGLFY